MVDVPTSMSGTILLNLINGRMINMQNNIGVTIGSNTISDKYQNVLVNLSLAGVWDAIAGQNASMSSISLGDFSIGKGNNVATEKAALYEKYAKDEMANLVGKYNYYKALG